MRRGARVEAAGVVELGEESWVDDVKGGRLEVDEWSLVILVCM